NRNRRMRNRMYGGVRGRKTKVGEKLLRFPPTRLCFLSEALPFVCFSDNGHNLFSKALYKAFGEIY
ncbi:MAG: hypothetical protein E6554_09265, partial [Bacteroides sp.]|nr:hypothetical protein [Bacteroides sp.]